MVSGASLCTFWVFFVKVWILLFLSFFAFKKLEPIDACNCKSAKLWSFAEGNFSTDWICNSVGLIKSQFQVSGQNKDKIPGNEI